MPALRRDTLADCACPTGTFEHEIALLDLCRHGFAKVLINFAIVYGFCKIIDS